MIELAKLEDAQKFEDIKSLLAHRNMRNKMLLEERNQAINLAKAICPKYDAGNNFLKLVPNLTQQINIVKTEIHKLTNSADEEMSCKKELSTLVAILMNNENSPTKTPPQNIKITVSMLSLVCLQYQRKSPGLTKTLL